MPASICGPIDAIQNYGATIIGLFLKKRIQLQRLAKLLTDSAISIPIPNLNALMKLSDITAATYNQLRGSCPQLGLPPASKGLGQLQNAVRGGYSQILNDLRDHPAQALQSLDDELGKLLGEAESQLFKVIGPGMSFAKCLSALCHTGEQLAASASDFPAAVSSTFQQLKDDNKFYGSLLDDTQKALAARVTAVQAGIAALIDLPVQPEAATSTSEAEPPPSPGTYVQQGLAGNDPNAGNNAQAGGTTTQDGSRGGVIDGSGQPGETVNQGIADLYRDGYGVNPRTGEVVPMQTLVRQGLCGVAVRETLEKEGAISGNPGLASAYQYDGYLSGLARDPNSGWVAVYVADRSQIPADGITVYNAVVPDSSQRGGYYNGHVQFGPQYNGGKDAAPNWTGSQRGVGGVYYQYTRKTGG